METGEYVNSPANERTDEEEQREPRHPGQNTLSNLKSLVLSDHFIVSSLEAACNFCHVIHAN